MSFAKALVCVAFLAFSNLFNDVQGEAVFELSDCGDSSKSMIQLKQFDYSPKPLNLPGEITLQLEGEVLEDIEGPIAMETSLFFTTGGQTQKIPCMNNFGSCFYADICPTLGLLPCPESLVAQGYECKCPIKKGTISIKDASFELPMNPGPEGDMHVKGNLYRSGKDIGCFEIHIHM